MKCLKSEKHEKVLFGTVAVSHFAKFPASWVVRTSKQSFFTINGAHSPSSIELLVVTFSTVVCRMWPNSLCAHVPVTLSPLRRPSEKSE